MNNQNNENNKNNNDNNEIKFKSWEEVLNFLKSVSINKVKSNITNKCETVKEDLNSYLETTKILIKHITDLNHDVYELFKFKLIDENNFLNMINHYNESIKYIQNIISTIQDKLFNLKFTVND